MAVRAGGAGDQDEPSEVRASEVRASEVRAYEVRASEVRASEVRASEVRASEVRASEVRASEVRASEVRASEVRASEVRASEVRAFKVCACPEGPYDREAQLDAAGFAGIAFDLGGKLDGVDGAGFDFKADHAATPAISSNASSASSGVAPVPMGLSGPS